MYFLPTFTQYVDWNAPATQANNNINHNENYDTQLVIVGTTAAPALYIVGQ